MKIVEIIPQLSSGGAERFVVDLCNELCNRHEVTLIVLHDITKYGFFLHELDSRVNVLSMNKKKGVDLSLPIKLLKVVKALKPDVVHTHLRSIIYITLALLKLNNLSCIHTLHNDAKIEASGRFGFYIRRFLFKRHLVVPVTISEASKDSFVSLYGFDPLMIYNGCTKYYRKSRDRNVYSTINRFSEDSLLLVNVARLTEQKNQLQLVQAVSQLRMENVDVELIIVGEMMSPKMHDDILAYHYPFVHLIGPRVNPRDYMKDADAFCLSSKYEGMPISLIECFSVGTIPICTPVGGIVNMIHHGENGILADDVSVESIKKSLLSFVKMSRFEKETMERKALYSFNKYSIDVCVQKYEQLMSETSHY